MKKYLSYLGYFLLMFVMFTIGQLAMAVKYKYKVMFVGDSGVGKTALTVALCTFKNLSINLLVNPSSLYECSSRNGSSIGIYFHEIRGHERFTEIPPCTCEILILEL